MVHSIQHTYTQLTVDSTQLTVHGTQYSVHVYTVHSTQYTAPLMYARRWSDASNDA